MIEVNDSNFLKRINESEINKYSASSINMGKIIVI